MSPQLDRSGKRSIVSLSSSTMVSIPREKPAGSPARSLSSPTHKLEQRRRIRQTLYQSHTGQPLPMQEQHDMPGARRQSFVPFSPTARIVAVHSNANADTTAMT